MIASTHAFMPTGLQSLRRTSPLAAARLRGANPGLRLGRAHASGTTTSLRMNLQVRARGGMLARAARVRGARSRARPPRGAPGRSASTAPKHVGRLLCTDRP